MNNSHHQEPPPDFDVWQIGKQNVLVSNGFSIGQMPVSYVLQNLAC